MGRYRSTALVLTACAALSAGCGGDDSDGSGGKDGPAVGVQSSTDRKSESEGARPIDFDALVVCLNDAGLDTSQEDADFLASAAGIGGVQVNYERNELNIAVERSPEDAENTLRNYQGFIQSSTEGQLKRVGTAAVAYNKTPTPEETQPVDKCLEESQ